MHLESGHIRIYTELKDADKIARRLIDISDKLDELTNSAARLEVHAWKVVGEATGMYEHLLNQMETWGLNNDGVGDIWRARRILQKHLERMLSDLSAQIIAVMTQLKKLTRLQTLTEANLAENIVTRDKKAKENKRDRHFWQKGLARSSHQKLFDSDHKIEEMVTEKALKTLSSLGQLLLRLSHKVEMLAEHVKLQEGDWEATAVTGTDVLSINGIPKALEEMKENVKVAKVKILARVKG